MSEPARDIITAIILAAGAGSRLGELGKQYSKPMVPILRRPLIDWVIERLRKSGVERVIVVGHPSDAQLSRFLSEHHRDAVLVQQPERRGIADALHCALPLLTTAQGYLACACDSLFPTDDLRRIIAMGLRHKGAACVGILEMSREATATRSAVRLDGNRVVDIIEKPALGSAPSGLVALPLYWLPHEFASCLDVEPASAAEAYISTALATFARSGGQIYASMIGERLEITAAIDVENVEQRLLQQRTEST